MKFTKHPSYDGLLDSDDGRFKDYKKDYDVRGFDDSVTWSLDHSLVKWLTPRLERFLEISKETTQCDELHKDVEIMLDGFKLYTSDGFNEFDEAQLKQVTKSFKLLSKNYRGLWW